MIAWLLLLAFVPALLALAAVWRWLGGEWGRFLPAYGLGALGLIGISAAVLLWTHSLIERDIAECEAAPVGTTVGCEDAGLLIVIVGFPCVVTLLLFLLAAPLAHFAKRQVLRRGAP